MKSGEEGFGGRLRHIYMFLALKMHFPQAPVFRNFLHKIECFVLSRQKLRAITFSRKIEIDRSGRSQWPKAQLARVL
jgi:hypothetical protein